MSITKDDVLKIAALAKLELTAEESEAFTAQLGSILDHISKLNQLDTAASQTTGTTANDGTEYNRRDDDPRPGLGAKTATEQAPDSEDGYFKVPKVIGG